MIFYNLGERGFEAETEKRLSHWQELREEITGYQTRKTNRYSRIRMNTSSGLLK